MTAAFNTGQKYYADRNRSEYSGQDPDFQYTINPAHGTLSGFDAVTGAVTYTPNSNYSGADSFTFTVTNGTNTSTNGTVSITVTPGTPTATPQLQNVGFNTPLVITLAGTDPDNPALTLTFGTPSAPAHGTLSAFNSLTGGVTYTPSANYHGTDSFTFTASNGTNSSAPATVSLIVATGTPTANGQSVTAAFNTAKAITLTSTDAENPALTQTFNTPSAPAHGALSGFDPATGAVTYTPANNYHGSDSFTFTVSNGTNTSTAGTVNITVTPGTPTATPQSQSVAFNSVQALTLAATDPDNPALTLTFALGASPAHGALSGFNAATGAVTYTPTTGYTGLDTFTFTASNGTNTSTAATVSLTVATGVPTATAQTVAVTFATAKSITVAGTDPDVPAKTLTFTLGTSPTHGALSGFNSTTGDVTYTPTTGYYGADSFTFTASNDTNTSAAATVTLNVAPGTPTGNPQTVITTVFTPVNFTLTATDPDVPALTLSFTRSPGQLIPLRSH